MLIAITIVQLLAALVLILIVLFQSGKSQGLSGAIGGIADSYMSKGKARTIDAKLAKATGHSEAIVTENAENAQRFVDETDSAAVYVNVSTRFTDGGEFGLGCEMGISTQKLHARGPMGLDELSTYKYIIRGTGQTR